MYHDFMREFLSGNSFEAYDYFGAHECTHDGRSGCFFRVYAPSARDVSVIGDFTGWNDYYLGRDEYGAFSGFIGGVTDGQLYKYRIRDCFGNVTEKADPYAFRAELPPGNASVVYDTGRFRFTDDEWIKNRDKMYDRPMNIYELHAGSWISKGDENFRIAERYSFSELIPRLIPYLRRHNFTHVELMPVMLHPYYGSWGYQCGGFFAVDPRYGQPDDLMRFTDECHRCGIGVILDFVPAHFAPDGVFLRMFDSTPMYGYDDPGMMFNEWGSCNFCHSKPAAASLLMSAADHMIKVLHADGLRIDAVSNLIYRRGDPSMGVNGDSIDFVRRLNSGLHRRHGNIILMAEDSTSYPKVTAPVEYGGLGFDYKWDMGWMNDTLNYFRTPPEHRPGNYYKLIFSMSYFYNELFLLSLSHDENVHGKATVMQKMWGDYDKKFPQCRSLYMYMFAHPGKKLNFMGNETGQLREWNEDQVQDRDILRYPLHDSFNRFFIRLGEIYRSSPALCSGEYNSACFTWLESDDPRGCIYAFQRSSGGETVIFVLNALDRPRENCRIGCYEKFTLTEIINSDSFVWSGSGMDNPCDICAEESEYRGKPYSFSLRLGAFGSALLRVRN